MFRPEIVILVLAAVVWIADGQSCGTVTRRQLLYRQASRRCGGWWWWRRSGTCYYRQAYYTTVSEPDPSCAACDKCEDWYNRERNDTSWLTEVNAMFPCPCNVTIGRWGLTPVDQPAADWNRDLACIAHGLPLCWKYHPGANGCLRSAGMTPSGARQQCCYDNDGDLLPPGHRGAGTPDRSVDDHVAVDVDPYNWCCEDCEEANSCDRYLEVRRGDNSHCI